MRLSARFVVVTTLMGVLGLIPSIGCNADSQTGRVCQYHSDCPGLCVEGRCAELQGDNAASDGESENMPNDSGGMVIPNMEDDQGMMSGGSGGGSTASGGSQVPLDCRNDGVGCTAPFICGINVD